MSTFLRDQWRRLRSMVYADDDDNDLPPALRHEGEVVDHISQLNGDVLKEILKYVDPADVRNTALAAKTINAAVARVIERDIRTEFQKALLKFENHLGDKPLRLDIIGTLATKYEVSNDFVIRSLKDRPTSKALVMRQDGGFAARFVNSLVDTLQLNSLATDHALRYYVESTFPKANNHWGAYIYYMYVVDMDQSFRTRVEYLKQSAELKVVKDVFIKLLIKDLVTKGANIHELLLFMAAAVAKTSTLSPMASAIFFENVSLRQEYRNAINLFDAPIVRYGVSRAYCMAWLYWPNLELLDEFPWPFQPFAPKVQELKQKSQAYFQARLARLPIDVAVLTGRARFDGIGILPLVLENPTRFCAFLDGFAFDVYISYEGPVNDAETVVACLNNPRRAYSKLQLNVELSTRISESAPGSFLDVAVLRPFMELLRHADGAHFDYAMLQTPYPIGYALAKRDENLAEKLRVRKVAVPSQ